MVTTRPTTSPHADPSRGRRGFSFVEVMFAIVILGVGFIMIAAIFPVAVVQTRSTIDDAATSAACKSGANLLAATMRADDVGIRTSEYLDVNEGAAAVSVFNVIRGDLVSRANPRYAFVPLVYRLPAGESEADVILIGAVSAVRSVFRPEDAASPPTSLLRGALEPKPVRFTAYRSDTAGGDGTNDWIQFEDDAAVAPGTFVVSIGEPAVGGGAIYQVVDRLVDGDVPAAWSLSPQYPVATSAVGVETRGRVLGRGVTDDGVYGGPSQDQFILRTRIPVN